MVDSPYSWHQVGDLLVVDNPIGTGMNKASDDTILPKDFDEIAGALLNFLKNFISKHPGYTDIILAGESMAGSVHTWLADKLIDNKLVGLNLHGIFLVNPWISAISQYSTMADFLISRDAISNDLFMKVSPKLQVCVDLLKTNRYDNSTSDYCRSIVDEMIETEIKFHKYNIKYPAKGSPYTKMQLTIQELVKSGGANKFLNFEGDTSYFRTLAPEIGTFYVLTYLGDQVDRLKRVLERSPSTRVTVMQGIDDFICNQPGTELWLTRIGAAPIKDSTSITEGVVHTTNDNVKMVLVKDAGHFVCWHRPDLCYNQIHELASIHRAVIDG